MKVLEVEKVIRLLEALKVYAPRMEGQTIVTKKFMLQHHLDMAIERVKKEAFEVDVPGGETK